MRNPSWNTVIEVMRFCWNNQQTEVNGEELNYFTNIAENIGVNERTVTRAAYHLEKAGLGKVFAKENKKCLRITVDLSNGEYFKE